MRAGRKISRRFGLVALLLVAFVNLQPVFVRAQGFDEAGFVPATTPSQVISNSNTVSNQAATRQPPPPTDALQNILTGIVYAFTVWIGSWVAYIGSYVFGFAAGLTLQSQAYSLDFISKMWTLVRDIANMAFLFLLIYIAFTVMFRADTRGTMQLLAGVITVALLVNFSFFFTRVVIDAGNILALQFYKTINVPNINGSQVKDLSAVIMQGTEVQRILNQQSFQHFAGEQTGVSGWFGVVGALAAIYVTVGIMLFILAAMFLAAGIKLLLRTVILWLAIIGSPLAFIAAALPGTRPHAMQWLKILVSHAFYPAVFLFLFLIIARFVESMGVNGSLVSEALLDAQGANGGILGIAATIASITIRLGFVVLLLFIAMRLSEMISIYGASSVNTAAGWMTGRTFGLGAAALGMAGRNIPGRIMANVSKSPTMATGAQGKGFGGALWRGTERVTKRLGSATYDIRNAPGAGLAKKVVEKATGAAFPTGTAATKGFVERAKEASEKEAKQRAERAAVIRDAANEAALQKIIEGMGTNSDEDKVKGVSKRDIENIKAANLEKIAHLLNEDKIKLVEGSDKFTDTEKESVKKIAEPIAKSQKIIGEQLRKLNTTLRSGLFNPSTINANTVRGHILTDAGVIAMKTDLQTQRTSLKTAMAAASAGDREDIKHDLQQLNNAINGLNDIQNNLRKIPSHSGRSAGEMKIIS